MRQWIGKAADRVAKIAVCMTAIAFAGTAQATDGYFQYG
jgi:hypothetical protein